MTVDRTIVSGQLPVSGVKVYGDDILADDAVFDIAAASWLLLRGDDVLQGVTVAGAGALRALGPTALDDGLTLQGESDFVNASALAQNGGKLTLGVSTGDATIARNLAGATWTLAGGAGVIGTDGSKFVNLGTLAQTGGSDFSMIAVDVIDHGTIEVEGALRLAGAYTRIFGVVEGAGEVEANTLTLIGATVSTSLYVQTLRVQDDDLISGANLEAESLVLQGGQLILNGSDLNASVVSGQGAVRLEGDSALSFSSCAVDDDVTLENSGALTVYGRNFSVDYPTDAYFDIAEQATVRNLASATWTDAANGSTYGGNGTFTNSGTFVEDGNATFDVAVDNEGTFQLGPALPPYPESTQVFYPTLDLADAVTGAGVFDLGSGGITFGGPVASGQTVDFVAGSSDALATLTLNDLAGFAASLSSFNIDGATDDRIVVTGNFWSFGGYRATGVGTGELAFTTSAAGEVDVPLLGDYVASLFYDDSTASGLIITYAGYAGAVVGVDSKTTYSAATPPNSLFKIAPGAALIFQGENTLGADVFAGSGLARNLGALQIDGGMTIADATKFVNDDDVTVNGGTLHLGPGSTDTTVFRNLAGATLTLAQGAGIDSNGDQSRLVNLGLLSQIGADQTSTIDVSFYNHGTLDVAGTLHFTGAITRLGGEVEGGGIVTAFNVGLVGTTLLGGQLRATYARLYDDVVANGSLLTLQNANLLGATLDLEGGCDLSATSIFGQGQIVNHGTNRIDGIFDYGSSPTLDDGVSLLNAGTLSTDTLVISGAANTGGSGELTNALGAIWYGGDVFGGTGSFADVGGTQAGFDNEGTFEASTPFKMGVPVINDGLIELASGYRQFHNFFQLFHPDLRISGPITGTGQIDLSGGTIEDYGSVGAGQVFNLSGAIGSALAIDDFVDFAGQLNFAPATASDVVSVTFATADWTYSGFLPGAAGVGQLMFSEGAQQKAISLSGIAASDALSVTTSNGVTTMQLKSG